METKINVELQATDDPHCRQILVDKEPVGLLMFHDWNFKVSPTGNSMDLTVLSKVILMISLDASIQNQKLEDERQTMARNARAALTKLGIDHSHMDDRTVVMMYMKASDK